MSNLSLYLASVLIWGSTWLAITYQYGEVAPEVSVAYRFALAAAILMGWCLAKRMKMAFTLRQHGWIALQGALMFGANYVLVYLAERRIPSGLMAVVFSLLSVLNILGARAFFKTPIRLGAMLGTAIGIFGVALVCLGPSSFGRGGAFRAGFVFAIVATVVSSLSNLLSQRNQRHGLPVMQTNAFGMLYGAAFVSIYCLAAGRPFVLDLSARYLGSLFFLSLFGSVIAFWAYLTLIGRIGAGRAGYAMVAIPIVALALSTAFEGLRWEWTLALGAALCLAGNFLVLPKAPKPAPTTA